MICEPETALVDFPNMNHSNWCNSFGVGFQKQPRLALVSILNARFYDFVAVVAMVCSSFVAINRGTNQRYPYAPLGAEEYPSVARGNLLASRYLVKNESVYAYTHGNHS